LVQFDRAHPLTTPRAINGNDPDVQRALADAAQLLQRNQAAGTARRWAGITLPGCPGETGCFNVIEANGPENGQRIGASGGEPPATSIFGSSFIMAVELTSHGPRARTILTYSQSANPASPHYSDQTVLFSNKRWVTEQFSEAEINADPDLQTTTLP